MTLFAFQVVCTMFINWTLYKGMYCKILVVPKFNKLSSGVTYIYSAILNLHLQLTYGLIQIVYESISKSMPTTACVFACEGLHLCM